MLVDAEAIRQHEEALRLQVRQLSDGQRQQFYKQFNKQLKDPDTYAVLNYLLVAGMHHFYLKRYARGWLNMGVFALGVGLMFGVSFWLGLGLIGVLLLAELPALFQSEVIVTDYNNRLMEQLLAEIRQQV